VENVWDFSLNPQGARLRMLDVSHGMVGTLMLSSSNAASVRGYDTWRAAGMTIDTLNDGHDAQAVTLLCGSNVTLTGGGNLRLSGGSFSTGSGGGTIRLVHDLASSEWQETSRSLNS
jgi:hypothetical protein